MSDVAILMKTREMIKLAKEISEINDRNVTFNDSGLMNMNNFRILLHKSINCKTIDLQEVYNHVKELHLVSKGDTTK